MDDSWIELDGSAGEGGGQIVRTALGLSLATGRPFRIDRIRARRPRPGLGRQHLTAVRAAAEIGDAAVEGASTGSTHLRFEPRELRGGEFEFDVGTAGSTTLVLQAVLPGLLSAPAPTRLRLHGGTHNLAAPPFEFLDRVFLPLLARMGAEVSAHLVRPGFYPAGGGAIEAEVSPVERLEPLDLDVRGRVRRRRAVALVAHLPESIGERELAIVGKRLGWKRKEMEIRAVDDSAGPGNALLLEAEAQHAIELVTGFGKVRLPAEKVATRAAREMRAWLDADVPVGAHLADQLLVPLALAGGGSFRTLPLTPHAETNARVIERFLPVRIESVPDPSGAVRVSIRAADPPEPAE